MSENRERVVVAVDELGQLWVRYWGPRGLVDRHLPMPAHPEQIPLVVSLSVGNLVRQEAFELLRDLERRRAEQPKVEPPPPPPAAPPVAKAAPVNTMARPAPPPARRQPSRSRGGFYWAGDFGYFPHLDRVCSPTSNIRCYDSQAQPVSFDVEGQGVAGGIVAAHARFALSYSHAITNDLWASVRVGFALTGGTVKSAAAEHDKAASKFRPWLLELGVQAYPFHGAFDGTLRPYARLATGFSEVSTELQLEVPPEPIVSGPAAGQRVTAVHAMGLLYAGVGVGLSYALSERIHAELELPILLAFPSSGWFVRPGAGMAYDF